MNGAEQSKEYGPTTVLVERVTTITRYAFDPPVLCRGYGGSTYAIAYVDHSVCAGHEDYWRAEGHPLTKTGKPNGRIDWRPLPDAQLATLKDLVRAHRHDSGAS